MSCIFTTVAYLSRSVSRKRLLNAFCPTSLATDANFLVLTEWYEEKQILCHLPDVRIVKFRQSTSYTWLYSIFFLLFFFLTTGSSQGIQCRCAACMDFPPALRIQNWNTMGLALSQGCRDSLIDGCVNVISSFSSCVIINALQTILFRFINASQTVFLFMFCWICCKPRCYVLYHECWHYCFSLHPDFSSTSSKWTAWTSIITAGTFYFILWVIHCTDKRLFSHTVWVALNFFYA